MTTTSSGIGSIEVPSKDPHEVPRWERGGWEATHTEEGELGDGGWGIVRRVVHVVSGQRRALKHPVHDDAESRSRFKREIEVQSKILDRHVMPILEHDTTFTWFTMPLAERTFHSAARGMSDDDIARVVIHSARGLQAAHKLQYIHRDVKPSNILELSRGPLEVSDWVVADFGIVRRPRGHTTNLKTVRAMGTEGFMAPEVAIAGHDSQVTPAADVYSLGRTIAWATTGIHPVGFQPLAGRGAWAGLVSQMTEFRPDERLQDMQEVIAGVHRLLAVMRAEREKTWGQTGPVAVDEAALTFNEQLLLAAVFELAWEPDDEGGEIAVTIQNLQREFQARGPLRVWLKRLVDLGYLRCGWYRGRDEPSMRTYFPTELAWSWAKQNERRIRTDLKIGDKSDRQAEVPPVAPGSDDDIPF